jgi:hypothetical protein
MFRRIGRVDPPKALTAPLHGYTEDRAREYLRTRSGGVCELCGAARATDYSHRQPRRKGIDWCPCDALHLCRDCHGDRVHGQPQVALMYGWTVSRHAPRGVRFEPVWLSGRDVWVRLDCVGGLHNAQDPSS